MPKYMVGRVSDARSRIMRGIRSMNTSPEMIMRQALAAQGLRYRLHRRDLPGCPDVVFVSARVAVFCDGDFWHGRGWKRVDPKKRFSVRRKFWVTKIEGNIARDRANTQKLRRLGWKVLRFWASDVIRDPSCSVRLIKRAVEERTKKHALSQIPKRSR